MPIVDTDESSVPQPDMDPALMDRDSAWWAKISHAELHRGRLNRVCRDFRAQDPLNVEPEPTDQPDRIAYRLHITKPIPLAIPLIVGDILHNLRSALDSLVYEMVRRGLDRQLTDAEERACQFPISPDPVTFDRFFTEHKVRNRITPQYLRDAIRWVQPFWWLEEAKALDVEAARDLTYEHRVSTLAGLAHLSNVDKHRRLAVTAWWPGLVYWTSQQGNSKRLWAPGDGTLREGSIVGYVTGVDEGGGEVVHEFNLSLPDLAPNNNRERDRTDVDKLAEAWVATTESVVLRLIQFWTRAEKPNPDPDDGTPLVCSQ
jgi:hypothetical protein